MVRSTDARARAVRRHPHLLLHAERARGEARSHEPAAANRGVRRVLRADDASLRLRASMPAGTLDRFCGLAGPKPRVLVVSAHPDDDVIGAGARMAALDDLRVVYLTGGAPGDPSLASPHVHGGRE